MKLFLFQFLAVLNTAFSFQSTLHESISKATQRINATPLHMAVPTLYGSTGSRSPLVDWAAFELDVPFERAVSLSSNPHPFGQIPCLVDGDATVFESGAILLYLLEKSPNKIDEKTKADIISWVVWANASLDPICFLETPEGKV